MKSGVITERYKCQSYLFLVVTKIMTNFACNCNKRTSPIKCFCVLNSILKKNDSGRAWRITSRGKTEIE